jgi:hypothetical protein
MTHIEKHRAFLSIGTDQINKRYGVKDLTIKAFEDNLACFLGPHIIVSIVNDEIVKFNLVKKSSRVIVSAEDLAVNEDTITFMKVSKYNNRFLLIGYKTGLIEIRDITNKDKNQILFHDRTIAGGVEILDLNFISDLLYGGLFVVTDEKEIIGVRLEREHGGKFTIGVKDNINKLRQASEVNTNLLVKTKILESTNDLYCGFQKS